MKKKRVIALILGILILSGTITYAASPAGAPVGDAALLSATQPPSDPDAEALPVEDTGSSEAAPPETAEDTPLAPEGGSTPAPAEETASGDTTPPPESISEVPATPAKPGSSAETATPEEAPSSTPPEATATPEDDGEGGETRTAPTLAVQDDTETLSLLLNESRTLQITVADLVDAPDDITLAADCTDPGIFAPATMLSGGEGGVYTLTLAPLGTGSATVTLIATNTADLTATASIAVTVQQHNRPPVFTPPAAALPTDEDTPLPLELGDYFTDPDGDTLAYTVKTAAQHGTVNITGTALTYTPDADYDQSDSFAITATDGEFTVDGSFDIAISPQPDAPNAVDDTTSCTTASGSIDIDVLANDTAVDTGSTLTITGITQPAAGLGTAALMEDAGRQFIRYTPNPRQAAGPVAFTYTLVHTGGTLQATGTVTVDVSVANNAPAISGLVGPLAGTEDTPLLFSFTVTDPDVASPPQNNLMVDIASSNFDILAQSGIDVTPVYVNDDTVRYDVVLVFERYANTAADDLYGTLEITVAVGDKNDPLSTASQTVAVNVAAVDNPPEIRYTPALPAEDRANERFDEDTSHSFTFEVYDPDMPLPAGDPGYTVAAESDTPAVLPNSAANISVAFVSKAENARVAVYQVTLTPLPYANTSQAAYATTPVTLGLSVLDLGWNATTQNVLVDVSQVNNAPTGKPLTYTVDEDTVIRIPVTTAGSDIDGNETIQFDQTRTDDASAEGGAITFEDDGKTLVYTPKQYYYGTDSFSYTLIDDAGATSEPHLVSITLEFINYPPTFTNLQTEPYITPEDTAITIPLQVFDPETALAAIGMQVSVSAGSELIASYTLADVDPTRPAERVLTIVPADNRNSAGGRNAQFKLVLGDGTATVNFTLSLTITPENDPPVGGTLARTFAEDNAITITADDILDVCSDVDITLGEDDALYIKWAKLGNATYGSLDIHKKGDDLDYFVYTPNLYFDGVETISFVVQDKAGAEDTGIIKLTAVPVNNRPVLGAITSDTPGVVDSNGNVVMDEDVPVTLNIPFFDPETPREDLILAVTSSDESVLNKDSFAITLTSSGCTLTITPRPDQFKEDPGVTVRFTVSDGENSVTRTFAVVVNPVNDVPRTPDLAYTVRDATTLWLDPLAECTDPDPGDVMELVGIVAVDDPGNGLTGPVGGLWSYTSEPGFKGKVTLQYTVKDSDDLTSTGIITITVGNTIIGASIGQLPALVFFSGQTVPTYTLTVSGLTPGEPYTLTAEVLSSSVTGSPVSSSSFSLAGGGDTLTVASAAAIEQTHTLDFALVPGVLGESVVRITIYYTDEHGDPQENYMNFKVTATRDNTPPVASNPESAYCNEGDVLMLDVLTDVVDVEDPLWLQMQIQQVTCIPNTTRVDVSIVQNSEGRWALRFTTDKTHNAHNSPEKYTLTYIVVDSGGETATASMDVFVRSVDHAPYPHNYVTTIDPDSARDGAQIDVAPSSNDYDGDTRLLADVRPDGGPGTFTAVIDDVTGKLAFTASVPGWYKVYFKVRSSFDGGTTWKTSTNEGTAMIGVEDPSGSVPPYFHSHTRYIYEDAAAETIDITNYIYASVGRNMAWEVVSTSPHIDKLESYAITRNDDDPSDPRYSLTLKPKPNANSLSGNPQIQIKWIDIDLRDAGVPEQDYTTIGTLTIHIYALNDAPVISEAPATLTLARGGYETFTLKVTDVDYPDQAKCDEQIRMSLHSSNNNVVHSESCVITKPTDGSGVWNITARGLFAGTCTLTLTATDQDGASAYTSVIVTVSGENTAPVAKDHYAVFNEDKKAAVVVYDAHTDAEGDPLTIILRGDTTGLPGYVAVEGDKITFMPDTDYCHSDTYANATGGETWPAEQYVEIEYLLLDTLDLDPADIDDPVWADAFAGHLSEVKKVRIHFNPVNDAPRFVALIQSHTMDEGKTGTITLRVTDVDSPAPSAEDITVWWETADDKIDTIVHAITYVGTATADGKGSTYDITLSITNKLYAYHASGDAPTAITVTVKDDLDASVTASLLLTINPTNDAPLLRTDHPQLVLLDDDPDDPVIYLEAKEDTPFETRLTDFYRDPDGDTLYIISLTEARHGTTSNPGNTAHFAPDTDYFTPVAADENAPADDAHFGWYRYSITDGAAEVVGSVKIRIQPVNDAPRLKAASRTTQEDTPLTIDLWGTVYDASATIWDVDNKKSELSIASVGTAVSSGTDSRTTRGGTLELLPGGLILYTPPEDYFGPDSFRYVVSDGVASSYQTVSLTVEPVDDPPRANFQGSASWATTPRVEITPDELKDVLWAFDEDATGSFDFRVWDPEGNGILTSYTTTAPEALLPLSRITLDGSGENLQLIMRPLQDQFGDFAITFTLDDGNLKKSYTVNARVRPVNDPPVIAKNTDLTMNEDDVLTGSITATDVEDAPEDLKYYLADDPDHPLPAHGTALVGETGSYSYTPNPDYYGTDVFYIMVADTAGGTAYAKMSVTVNPVNDAPTPPTDLAFSKTHYGNAEVITLTWTAGTDLANETAREDLLYDIDIRLKDSDTVWTSVYTRKAVTYAAGSCSVDLPAALLAGVNTDTLRVRVRTWDTGAPQTAVYAKPSESWAEADNAPAKVDSTPPVATHTLQPSTFSDSATATITLQPGDNSPAAAWQAGFDHMDAPTGATAVAGPAHTYTVAANGRYVFALYDSVGNKTDYPVDVVILDRTLPTITADAAFDDTAGKVVNDAVAITLAYADPADATAPIDGGEAQSGLVAREYQLLRGTAPPAGWESSTTGWTAYTAPVALELKGSYTILARAKDAAGNVTTRQFGPYVINNSAPVAVNKTVDIYREDVTGTTLKKMLQSLTLQAADDDTEDSLTYHWETADTDYTELATYADLDPTAGPTDAGWTLTHKGGHLVDDLTSKTYTLRYYAKDDDSGNPLESSRATVTVTLHPVNHLPQPPSALSPGATTLQGGAPFTLSWAHGSDVETADALLRYQIRWRLSNADDAWQTAVTTSAGATSHTLTLPDASTEFFQLELRTLDDNPGTRTNPDNTTGNARSTAVLSDVFRIDADDPTISITQSPTGWTNSSVAVTVNITDTGAGQAGIKEIALNGSTVASYTATDPARGSYSITLPSTTENDTAYTYVVTDHAGNTATKTHTVTTIDRLPPSVAATPPDGTVLGYAGTPITVTLAYTDAAAITGQDGSSGVPAAQKWVRWYKEGATPGDYVLYGTAYPSGITFDVRGKYYIDAWCYDNAANSCSPVTYGPYEVANSPPEADDKTLNLYEHGVAGQGSSSITITLTATEPDGDDMRFAFTDTTALGSWATLTPAADTAWPGDTWTLTHDGSEFATTSVALTYKATDDFVDYLDNSESAPATVTVNLVPVNDAPTAPTNFAIDTPGPYRGGQSIALSWLAGSDVETATNDLVYVVAWPDTTVNGGWDSTTTSPGATTATITLPAGINTSSFEVRVRTQDDNSTNWNPDGSTGPALSPAARIENIKVDSTAPTATHTLEKATWTRDDVRITLAPADGTAAELWQAGVSHIAPPSGVSVEAGTYVYKTTGNGRFVFVLHDLAGNTRNHTVDVTNIDTVAPTITPSETAIAAGAGKRVSDNVAISLSYTDPVDSTAPIDGGNATSGLTATQYKLLRDTTPPAGWENDTTGWSTYIGTAIPLTLKGSYTLLVRAADAAGNVTTRQFGPYVINNTTPVAHAKAYTVYEHAVTAASLSNTVDIQMTGADDDTEDAPQLTFAWVQDTEYDRLLGLGSYSGNAWGTLALADTGGKGSYTFTHNGREVETLSAAERTFTLRYTATDPANATSTAATVTITLVPVNHRPAEPDSIAAADTLYRQGDTVALSWALGTSLDRETDDADLVYDVEYTLDGSAWTALPAAPYSGTGPSVAITAPAGNSATYRFRVRTKDTNPAGTGFIDEVTGTPIPGVSPWVESPNYRLDNTAPTATHTLAPAADTGGDVIVTLAPADATPTASWQSGIDRVEHPVVAGLSVENAATYKYRITQDGSYLFKIYDVAGNLLEYTVATGVPADPVISYSTTHTRRGQQIALSWTHPTTTAHYELQVSGGSSWSTLVAAAAGSTAKSHTYTVPATCADTAQLRFRVRAWDSAGLHSANWSTGHDILCDTTQPTITLTPSTANGVYTNQDVTVTVAVTDSLARLTDVTVQQDGVDSPVTFSPAAGAYNTSVVFSANGMLTVTARDACGNVATAVYAAANIDKAPPVVDAVVTTNGEVYTSRSGHPLHFAISFSDGGVSGIASREYAITASSDTPASWTPVYAATAAETRSALGQYHLHLRASDFAGNVTTRYAGMFEVYNTPPQAQAQTVEVDEGDTVDFDVLAVENDPNDTITKWVVVTPPAHGTLTHLAGNTFRYAHDGEDPIADDYFTYYVEDSRDGVSNTARVTLRVAEVNDPPFIHNLPAVVDIPWNTSTPITFDIADADDLTATLSWLVRTGDKTVLPLNAVNLAVTPRADGHQADVVMHLTPVQGAFTEANSPVSISLRLRDAEGLQAVHTLLVNVVRTAQPPTAQDQYHFVLPGGTVRGAIAATPDHESSIVGYTFGPLSAGSQCALTTAADGSFSLTAPADFVSDAFPVRVHDANGLCTDITVYVSSQAISRENTAVDRLVSSVPGLATLDPASAKVRVESSSHPDILPVENCDFVLAEGGELQLYYNPASHRYGDLTLTLNVTLADGTTQTLAIPISIKPVNDAPVVTVKTDSPLNDGVYDVYIGESMTGTLLADDSLDETIYVCQNFSFSCLPGHQPQFGTLRIGADGRYTYTPDAGFEGEDEFCITVAECTGWAENQNPTSLPAGVIDVSNGVPLLAQVVHFQVSVGKRPPPAKPEKPTKPDPSQPPETPASPPDAGAPADTSTTPAGPWTPALEVADTPEGGGTTYEKPDIEAPEVLPEAEPPDDDKLLGLTDGATAEGQLPGWLWPVIAGTAALVIILILLLFGCRIRITCVWRDDAGRPQTRTRTRWFKRLRPAGAEDRQLDITIDDTGPLAGLAFRVRFGPLYRRRFYTQPIRLTFGAHALHTHIPEKDAYRQNGLKAKGTDFAPE